MNPLKAGLVKATVVLAILLGTARAQENGGRVGYAKRVATAPALDGIVGEQLWQEAIPLVDFVQAEPHEGLPATEKTEVRIVYNEDTLFFGVVCYDQKPSEILVTESRRDSGLTETDSFQIILDTYHDRQNGFVFGTNPVGIEYDGQVTNEGEGGQGGPGSQRAQSGSGGGFNLNWDGTWQVRTQINQTGWMAEFAIPLRTLRYSATKPQLWGVNFMRNIRRKREQDYWSPVSRIYNLYRLSSAGQLHGLELETPRNFKVTPYLIGTANRDFANSLEADYSGDFGLDAKLGLTPSLNLDLTYNTDFAQVEVDEQQINLTRFNLFFPEKRPFFLENAGIFAVGQSEDLELFFSRRIGIDRSGFLVPIVGGAA